MIFQPRKPVVLLTLFVMVAAGCMRILPAGVPARISKGKLKGLLNRDEVVIVDVRHDIFWQESGTKIPGAVRGDAKGTGWADRYDKDAFLVLYCACGSDQTSLAQAEKLMDLRYTNVWVLSGGWVEWVESGFPLEEK